MTKICWDLLDDVVKASGMGSGKPKVLMYDVRSYAKSTSVFPPNHRRVESYLNKKDVRAALHATDCTRSFKECTDPPYDALKHQDGLGVTKELAAVLDHGVRALFYNGKYDMICNHVGVESALDKLNWKGASEFRKAAHGVWSVGGSRPSGYVKSAGNLASLVVLDSGHMVPLDRPAEALDMIHRFIRGRRLNDS